MRYSALAMILFSAIMISGCSPKKTESENSAQNVSVSAENPPKKEVSEKEVIEQLKNLGAKLEFHTDGKIKSVNVIGVEESNPQIVSDVLQKRNGLTSLTQLKMSGKLHGNFAGFAERFPSLTSVAFDRSDVDDEDLAEIVKVKRLNVIFLSNTAVTDQGIALLGQLGELRNIRLGNTSVTDNGIRHLAQLKQLKNIDLSNTAVGNATLAVLGTMPQLERINLYMTKVTDDGIDAILPLRNIVWLNLDACQIGDVTVPKLTAFKKMTFLHLGKTNISDVSIAALKEMQQLKELHITETKITRPAAESLASAMPHDCVLVVDKEGEK